MAFSVSPAVLVTEIDKTNTISAVSTSIGALVAGNLNWGPCDEISQITSETDFLNRFGSPDDTNYKDWFTAANFLQYSNSLKLIRVVEGTALNASGKITTGSAAPGLGHLIKNESAYTEATLVDYFYSKYPGAIGNSLTVVGAIPADFPIDATTPKTFILTVDGVAQSAVEVNTYFDAVALAADELALLVVFNDATTNTDTVVERMIVSTTPGSKNGSGQLYYLDDYLQNYSDWIYGNYAHTDADTYTWAIGEDFALTAGSDGVDATVAEYQLGMDIFAAQTEIDINLLMTGGAGAVAANYAITAVAEVRKDCLAFLSPSDQSDVINATDATAMIATKNSDLVPSSSYGTYDGNYKYMYDKYNDVYRWVPFNGDVAGLCALTDNTNDPWFSPAGFNRGRIKGTVKLAFQPAKASRDEMYKNNINPIAAFQGDGVILFGDKTLQAKTSAFQYINVRRLFIVLEKSISTSAKYLLFEFNDAQTQALFRNMVEPFLRRVKGRRGLYDYRVVADNSVNTPEVVDAGEFVAEIYIKPARSIQVINLNFIATKTGVSFEEVAGV